MKNQQVDNFFLNHPVVGGKNLSEVNVSEAHNKHSPLQEETSTDNGFLLAPMGVVFVIWTLLVLVKLDFWKRFRNRLTPVKSSPKIPCSHCRFFKNDPYLKCAVHPGKVLSEEAINCVDYWSENSDQFRK
ncbi:MULTISPECIES: hypothetical protein [unclassified Coleofasciculus]|uniref:hypothetical protein n=1 Tax=unclassified Coleofasciculus TaxID=2692782 RepID=UPI0018829F09|nr:MULTISPECIES: hypothetical protein [unclassified Coleofasciculus]MBE9126728.1 hypothetical protein [Coleofasciculus sp. LEGE 07081]MBE9149047.1 hypothetical protein [Coleofasciculus sp. LEGE 07092]